MDCIACGLRAGYNRAVVDLYSGAELDGFCLNCERGEFGRSLERSRGGTGERCLLCNRDGQFALPLWVPSLVDEAGRRVSRVDYAVTVATPRLCDEQFDELRGGDEAPAGTRRVRHSRGRGD